jgi:hypothetical protein
MTREIKNIGGGNRSLSEQHEKSRLCSGDLPQNHEGFKILINGGDREREKPPKKRKGEEM